MNTFTVTHNNVSYTIDPNQSISDVTPADLTLERANALRGVRFHYKEKVREIVSLTKIVAEVRGESPTIAKISAIFRSIVATAFVTAFVFTAIKWGGTHEGIIAGAATATGCILLCLGAYSSYRMNPNRFGFDEGAGAVAIVTAPFSPLFESYARHGVVDRCNERIEQLKAALGADCARLEEICQDM